MPRYTIATAVSAEGVGLHTGATTRVTFRPAPAGQGIGFRRVDLPGAPEIPARLDAVRVTERRTGLGAGGATVETVEHLLAAVAALELDDLVIELDGPEPPLLDGSFAPYFHMLIEAGLAPIRGEPVIFRVSECFTLVEGDAAYRVSPEAGLRLSATIEWAHVLIGRQSGSWRMTPDVFREELARARTFGFTAEIATLRSQRLLQGGSLGSAVVLSETEVLGTALRWPDEFLRHKTGDLLGDLALLGGRLEAHIRAERPSHRGNIALARRLLLTTPPAEDG